MAQLTTFTYCKDLLKNYHYLNDYPMTKTFLASMMGGIFTALAVTPFDLIATRLYNQGNMSKFINLMIFLYYNVK